jgi:chaperonin cofactor prefoldin
MTLEEKVEFLMKKIEVLEEDIQGLQLQIDLMADRVYDYTNEYEIEL